MILVANLSFVNKPTKTASIARCFLLSLAILCLFIMLVCLAACDMSSQRTMFVLAGPIMGTDYRITVVTDSVVDQEKLHQNLLLEMNKVNDSMSHYFPSSELSKLNNAPANQAINLSDKLNQVMTEALLISKQSNGAFDVTLGPIIDLWGFGANGTITEQPSLSEMKAISQSVGYSRLSLQEGVLIKGHSNTQINLSAIAKGFAVDQVAQTLEKNNFHNYLINIGGELKAAGVNSDSQSWRVGIEKPELLGGIQQIITLNNEAVATSGDYLNYVIIDGQQYSHTIDPTTLSPVLHRLASVSVIHQNASTADALATAIMAMGEVQGLKFAEQQQLAAYLVVRDDVGDGLHVLKTTKISAYLSQ